MRPIVVRDRCGENYVLPRWIRSAILEVMGTGVRVLAKEDCLAEHVSGLINDVYVTAESGMWRAGTTRTTSSEIAGFIAAGEIVVATRDGEVGAAVRVHDVAGDATEFGLLAAAPERRGTGLGRALLDFAEESARTRGRRAMQLELLVPRDWTHPSKEFLKGWYGRRGYRRVRIASIADAYPHLAPLLATACDLEVHEKPLR
jgi:GNAT superfamily N-acetyltransferase